MTNSKKPGLLLIGVGTILTSMAISGFILGYVADLLFDTSPFLMLICGGLGFVGGLLKVYKYLTDPRLN